MAKTKKQKSLNRNRTRKHKGGGSRSKSRSRSRSRSPQRFDLPDGSNGHEHSMVGFHDFIHFELTNGQDTREYYMIDEDDKQIYELIDGGIFATGKKFKNANVFSTIEPEDLIDIRHVKIKNI